MSDSDDAEHDPSQVPADERSELKNKVKDLAVGDVISVQSGDLIADNVIVTKMREVRAQRALNMAHTRL